MYLCNHVQFTCTAVILHIKDICCGVQKGSLNALTSLVIIICLKSTTCHYFLTR